MALFFILFIIIVLIPIALGILIYYLINRKGNKKYANIFAVVYSLFLLFVAINVIFEDELFSKSDAIELLNEQNIHLEDDFKLLENESMSGIGDYYHTFTIEVSQKDKDQIIQSITKSANFKKVGNGTVQDLYLRSVSDKELIIQNFERDDEYVREFLQSNGEGYAPTYRKFRVQKRSNKIIFEDIDE